MTKTKFYKNDQNIHSTKVSQNNNKIVVTAALPYANGQIHIGHLLEYIQADIYVRYLKLIGKDSLYICASDQHGTPIEVNARKAKQKPEDFVQKFWKVHQEDFKSFLIDFDNYHKTHSPENRELAEWFFHTLKEKGYTYTKEITQLFDEKAKRFLPDRYIKGGCPKCQAEDQYGDVCEKCGATYNPADLIDPYSTLTQTKPVLKKSTHYFFKLGNFSSVLKKWINANDSQIQPEIKNSLNDWLKKGLEDWCISRDGPYFGFEIPGSKKETGQKKYFYVWLDAPIGYISSTKNYCDKKKLNWKDYWYDGEVFHIIGKDIVYFHYLFWPAMLHAVGIPLPKLSTHGFITVDGQKMSKSRGTFFTAKDFLKLYPAEALRFYYASHLDRKLVDVDLSFDDFVAVNNNVLTGNIGNFCYRVLTFAQKNYGKISEVAVEGALTKEIEALLKGIQKDYSNLDFKSAVKKILKISDIGNIYFQEKEPWKDKEEKEAYVGFCVNIAKDLAVLLNPILPEFSEKIFKALGKKFTWDNLGLGWKGDIGKVDLLVQKIEKFEEETFPLQMAVGEIQQVENHPDADSLYLLGVDFGKLGKRQVVAGLKKHFTPKQLEGKKAVFCVNLKKAKIRGKESQAMIMVADDGKKLAILEPKGKKGEFVEFDNLSSSSKEVNFDEFKKLKMLVKDGKVWFDKRELKCVKVKGVEGARIY